MQLIQELQGLGSSEAKPDGSSLVGIFKFGSQLLGFQR